MKFLRNLLSYIFQLGQVRQPQEEVITKPVPPPSSPEPSPISEQDPLPIEEVIEPNPSPEISIPENIAELPPADSPTPSLIPLLEKALDKTFGKKQKTAIESIEQALSELQIQEPRYIAYIFATAWHESKLKPIKERRALLNTQLRKSQDRYWDSGYYGRGFVQITWKQNYAKFAKLLSINLVEEPDLALEAQVAAQILVLGMRDGLFTGVRLSQFFNDEKTDWLKARRIVNGNDQAELIATYGASIFQAIAPKPPTEVG